MNRKFSSNVLAAFAATACLALGASAAMASGSPDTPFRVQLGGYFPSNGTIRDLTANTQFDAGLSYDIQKAGKGASAIPYGLYVNLDSVKKHGYALSTAGVGIDARSYFSADQSSVKPYVGLGIGGYNVYSDDHGSHNDFKFGGKISAGIETQRGVYLEAGYTAIGKAKLIGENKTLDPSGASVDIGYKF
jgi:hypothetical protein